ncbi:glutaminyl-peptide cyclotransferase [Aquimarina brevivitae]|uniref:Glutaminyl-peptide cyclotransferase n=1 Tax=Aquimarina brevivitae TaxID=323412 RepID=A0A4Q7P1C1_9FLAO|nr:glutaminyl-peptide cyclotransferase [Aquimarina brevivitae]RZS93515.1 glutaminyl-peptide cyclotransferase [Aquimarina brevivitae]
MCFRKILLVTFLAVLNFSCGSNPEKKKTLFTIKMNNEKGIYKLGDEITASIISLENIPIDSVTYTLQAKKTKGTTTLSFTEKLDDEKLGNHYIKAQVFYQGNIDTVSKKLLFINDKAPKLYSYKIIETYPHDRNAFTQGLEFHQDTLYESTGKNGLSSLRKTDYQTGEVLVKKEIAQDYFAEGITIINDKIYQLTWLAKKGFIYNLKDLEKTGSFDYNQSKEGWGLCNDGQKIYKSDGTEKIWILDPKTLKEIEYIQITTNKSVKTRFNELEWVNGKIYANTWQKDGIAIINPKNGALEAVINLAGLRNQVKQHPDLDVLNGIAYNNNTGKLYVTGKNWSKLFEIELVE